MDTKEFQLKPRYEWIWKGSQFSILVSCHESFGDEWAWCIYALIYDNHPLFMNVEAAVEQLPWHCGCTYDERFTQEPARGIRYDWQRKGEWLKIGADYSHLHDEYFRACPPSEGVPGAVLSDARELFEALSARAAQATGEAS